MIAVLTADIINSTRFPDWRKELLKDFEFFGNQNDDWLIYRGDGIQIRIEKPEEGLRYALLLKAIIRQIENLDVRIAIGLGEENERTSVVTQNSGSAYVNSGRMLENLKQNLAINTGEEEINLGLNAGLGLLNALCSQWKPAVAQSFKLKLQNPDISQNEMAKILKTTQPNISQTLARGNWHEIAQYIAYFNTLIKTMS